MKILLQHVETKKFLTREKDWTLDPEEAETFRHAHLASTYCAERGISDMQILIRLSKMGIERIIPIRQAANYERRHN